MSEPSFKSEIDALIAHLEDATKLADRLELSLLGSILRMAVMETFEQLRAMEDNCSPLAPSK